MNKILVCLLVMVILLSACSPSQSAVQTAIAQTALSYTATPEDTATPAFTPTVTLTFTPLPTSTRTATLTRTATATKTPTRTPTITFTPLDPKDQTATSVKATSEAKVLGVTQTAAAGATAYASTIESIKITATAKAAYKEIYWRELVTYPDKHKDEQVIVRGRVFNVINDYAFQIWLAGTYEAVLVVMSDTYSDLYEDQAVTVYGVVGEPQCFKNAYNADVCPPKIFGDFFTRP